MIRYARLAPVSCTRAAIRLALWATIALGALAVQSSRAAEPEQALVTVKADSPASYRIPRFITGKFAEHLGSNIYNGMSAQILRNPTFGDVPFADGSQTPDGRPHFLSDEAAIAVEIRRQAARLDWPEAQIAKLIESRRDALADWWVRVGPRDAVKTSPDTGPFGGRAQRVQVQAAGQGVAQWTFLPLQRVRRYECELALRSPDLPSVTVSLTPAGSAGPVARLVLQPVSGQWTQLKGELNLPASAPPDAIYRFAVTAPSAGQLVLGRALLLPADNVNGADPDIVRLLKESHLPILRWPGGNFASAYHWEDGVGPSLQRPTRPNWAWGGIEPNLFGTDEFIAFCRAVGCEPMICINAGDGTPREAAQWVEYCNGPPTSPMGAKRAANGHPRPYNVHVWEVGNELWGHWQVNWTTPAGYVDRFRQFSAAMLEADPKITLYACGAPVLQGRQWNQALIAGGGPAFGRITDHPLIGGDVPPDTDPLDVYRDFMAVPDILRTKWTELHEAMSAAGIRDPRLAITELQMFAHLSPDSGRQPGRRLTHRNLVNPGTQAEALYDTLMYHAAVRLGGFVDLVTHSAVVNHGGGLRKEHERVYANPCYYAQSAFAAFQGTTPVAVEVQAPQEQAPTVLPDIASIGKTVSYPVVSALAARADDGSLLVSVVNRGTAPQVHLTIRLAGFSPASQAQVWSLGAAVPWAVNSLEAPDAVKPVVSSVPVVGNSVSLDLRPYTVLRIHVAPGR